MCATHRSLTARAARPVLGEVARNGLSMGSPALRWCAWIRRTMWRRSQVASRWMPSPTCLRPSGSPAATCQPFRSRALLAADLWTGGEAAPRPGHRGGAAIDRHTRDEPMVCSPRRRCQAQQRSRPRRPRPAHLRRFVQWETVIRMTRRCRFASPSNARALYSASVVPPKSESRVTADP